MLSLPLLFALALARDTNPPAAPVGDSTYTAPARSASDTLQQPRPRPRPVEYSDAYAVRLEIHRIGSYTMLPLFAAEYALGQNLINDARPASWIKPTHAGVALGIGALFTVNTITGAWNLWDSRADPAGRTRRIIHTTLMLASDAGFVWAGATGQARGFNAVDQEHRHRNIALGSIALSTAGTAMMWFWKN